MRAVCESDVEVAIFREAVECLEARGELLRLTLRRGAAVVAEHRRGHAVALDQLCRLCIGTRCDLDRVTIGLEQSDERCEDERVRARGEIDPDAHSGESIPGE